MRKKRTLLDKLEQKYHLAASDLVRERDRIFPPGMRVRCKLTGLEGVVQEGSLYPYNIKLNDYHYSLYWIEPIEEKP